MPRKALNIITALLTAVMLTACIDDTVSGSPSHQPSFASDTLHLGTVFTQDLTTTQRLTVYNRNSKAININHIEIPGSDAQYFRLNVDGQSGREFNNIEIRANDSIFVLVEALFPENASAAPVEINAPLQFTTAGVTQTVTINASRQDVVRLRSHRITGHETLSASKPYQVYDSLVIEPGATLVIPQGTTLHFHDKASMIVHGTLITHGTPEHPVNLCGDRTGNVITNVTFDLMSRQWQGLQFTPTSHSNSLTNTSIRNTVLGVIVDGGDAPRSDSQPMLTLTNSQLRNSGDMVLRVYNASVVAQGCEFAEGASGLVLLDGGNHTFNHCTFANYYLFAAISGPNIQFANIATDFVSAGEWPTTGALFTNSILYGLGASLSHGNLEGTDIMFNTCLLKEDGTNDNNFLNCLWGQDPLYYTERSEYIFDYRLRPESPAINAGDASLTLPGANTDPYGTPRLPNPAMGAYQPAK